MKIFKKLSFLHLKKDKRSNFKKLLKKRVFPKIQKLYASIGPREKYIVGLLALIIFGSALAIGVQLYLSNTKAQPKEGGEYREALIGLPRFLNPALSTTNDVDRDLTQLLYSSLVKYDQNGNIIPDLAETFEILDEGKEYRFTLKRNLFWEDGKPLTAQDVLFTIQLIQNSQYSSSLYQSWQGVNVSIENENIIVFKLSNAYPPFLENATVGILPSHIWEKVTAQNFTLSELNLRPIGSGPFKVEKFTRDNSGLTSSYTLQKNDNYHGKKPYLDRITFKFYPTEEDAIRAYNSKAVDAISFVSSANIALLKNTKSLNLHEFKIPRIFSIFFNSDAHEELKTKTIRQALNYATNKTQIIEEVLGGFGQVAKTPIPPNLSAYYHNSLETLDYDLAKARMLLSENGWEDIDKDGIREKTDKDGLNPQKLSFTLVTANRTELKKVAELIQNQWKEAGILLKVTTMEFGELQQVLIRPRSYQMLLFGTILSAIPDPYPFWHSSQINDSGLNFAKYSNNDVDKLLEKTRREINDATRIEQYKELQNLIVQDAPAIFLYDPFYIYPVHKAVQGIQAGFIVDTSHRFVDIENWYIETKRVF